MLLSGQLADFSLPEIFQVAEDGKQTGILTLWLTSEVDQKMDRKYIYFSEGRVISACDNLSGRNLINLLKEHGSIHETQFHTIVKLIEEFDLQVPLGNYLQAENILTLVQIQEIFKVQVLQKICSFFEIEKAWFTFNIGIHPSPSEMTGISANATKISLIALRSLKNWKHFAEKFPEPSSGLLRTPNNKTSKTLTVTEEKIFGLADGTISLRKISQSTQIPLEEVQKIGFYLISTGQCEELPVAESLPAIPVIPSVYEKTEYGDKALCQNGTFLTDLANYLQKKAASPVMAYQR